MPVLTQTISELTQHVFFPLIRQMSHRILSRLAYTKEIGDNIYINTDWSTHSKTSDIENNANIATQAFRVEAQTQLNPSSQKFDTYTFQHTTAYGFGLRGMNAVEPIYYDKLNGVRIIETISPVTIVMNCDLILQSTELAFQAPQRIFNSFENGAIYHYNDLVYDYPVPHAITSVLYELWKMDRSIGRPAGISFGDYIKLNTKGLWQTTVNRKDTHVRELVVPKIELKTLATCEYSDDKPNPVQEGRLTTGYSIPFMYTFQFFMPTMNIMQFPVVYNNQLVPAHCIPEQTDYGFNRMHEHMDMLVYDEYRGNQSKKVLYKRAPEYDDWIMPGLPVTVKNKYSPIIVVAATIDEDTPTTIIELSEIGDDLYNISSFLKETLYQQGEESLYAGGLYHVALFRGDKALIPGEDYTFNENLQLEFTPLNTHHQYHVVISGLINIIDLDPKWYDWVKMYFALISGDLRNQIAQQINTGGQNNPSTYRLRGTSYSNNKKGTTGAYSPWRDPSWPPGTTVDLDSDFNGVIYDPYGELICMLTDSNYPLTSGDNNYALSANSRVQKISLIAKRPG